MTNPVPAAMRESVRMRATRACEYCRIHEEDTRFHHEPDYIIARKHRGETEPDNLAWTCFVCNRHKGTDLASIDPDTGEIVRLSHPRRDRWQDHFRLETGSIIALTPEGRVTEFLLQFNHPKRVRIRLDLMRAGRHPRS